MTAIPQRVQVQADFLDTEKQLTSTDFRQIADKMDELKVEYVEFDVTEYSLYAEAYRMETQEEADARVKAYEKYKREQPLKRKKEPLKDQPITNPYLRGVK